MDCNLFTDVRQESKGFSHCQILWKSLFALYLASQDNNFIYYVLTVLFCIISLFTIVYLQDIDLNTNFQK